MRVGYFYSFFNEKFSIVIGGYNGYEWIGHVR